MADKTPGKIKSFYNRNKDAIDGFAILGGMFAASAAAIWATCKWADGWQLETANTTIEGDNVISTFIAKNGKTIATSSTPRELFPTT